MRIMITGAEGKVNGLKFKDRATGVEHHVALEGVFVQIGLIPNTEWLKGTVALQAASMDLEEPAFQGLVAARSGRK